MVDPSACTEDTIWVYNTGSFQFLFIASLQQLYFEDGTFYCQTSTGLDCLPAYGLTEDMIEGIWVCTNNSFVEIVPNFKQSLNHNPLIAVSTINFELYPNPSNGEVFLKIKEEVSTNTHLSIFDATGRIVYQQTFATNSILDRLSLDLNSYKKGFYFVELKTENSSQVKKLLIH